jgi:hypothetical protein
LLTWTIRFVSRCSVIAGRVFAEFSASEHIMGCRTLTPILRCSDCGSQLIELRGPVTDYAVVRCAGCGAAASRWAEFLSELGARVERLQQQPPRRCVRYRARMRADPAPAWRVILTTALS